MAIAFRVAKASATTSAASPITMIVPNGVIVDGDIMVMHVASKSTTIPTLPTGWTSLITNATSPAGLLCWRIASSEPTSYAVTTAAVQSAGSIIVLSNSNPILPVAAQYSIQNNTSSATVTAAAEGSYTSNNGIDLFMAGLGSSTSVPAAPTNYTQPTNGTATSAGIGTAAVVAGCAYRALSATTTVGIITATWSATGVQDVAHVFIFEIDPRTYPTKLNNYQFVRVGDGMSTGERIR